MRRARVFPIAALVTLLVLLLPKTHMSAPQANAGQQKNRKPTRSYQVVHGWPVLPEGHVLGQVSGVAVDSHNHVFAFHRGDHSVNRTPDLISEPTVMCFDGETGKLVASWGADMFVVPHGLRVDRDDNVWITDVGLHQVFKFTHDGKQLMVLGIKNTPGADGKHFNMPTDVAFASDGSFYVSDGYGNSRVAKFSSNGDFLLEWGRKGDKPGEFNLPHSVVTDSQGRVYVADRSNARIQVFNGEGKFLEQWKSAELGRPWALDIGPDGNLYVVDGGDMTHKNPDRASIMKVDLNGHLLESWSSFGNYDGQIYWGHDIAVGKDGGIYVGDVYFGMRVQKWIKTEKNFLYLPR